MGMSTGGSQGGVKTDINITPLVDVVLVLLIIFMVVTPELQRGKEVKLPNATTAKRRDDGGDPVVVSVTPSRQIWIEQEQVPDEAALTEQIKDALKAMPGRGVLIKGDQALKYGDVKGVITAIRNAGAPSVSLAAN